MTEKYSEFDPNPALRLTESDVRAIVERVESHHRQWVSASIAPPTQLTDTANLAADWLALRAENERLLGQLRARKVKDASTLKDLVVACERLGYTVSVDLVEEKAARALLAEKPS